MSPLSVTVGSFGNGNADVRLCVSCANFGSWHSYELETLRTPRIHTTVVAKNRVVLEAPMQLKPEGLANQRPSLARVSVHALYTFVHKQLHVRFLWEYGWWRHTHCVTHSWKNWAGAASLIAKVLVRHNGSKECSTVKVGCFVRRTARCIALQKLPIVTVTTVGVHHPSVHV